jgi:DNA (cytosine-5)-methyltransferase 1
VNLKINLLDLFSGIGGFHLGLEKAGFEINSYNSEIDKYAIQVYKHNFKDSKYVGSVTDVRGSELPRINGITFGSPCQDFSLAGRRKGMSGERSSLILEAIRLIKECRPDFFIWENVKGTFSSNNRQDFAAILQAFTNIGGYRLEWQLLNTKWFLPQNRERVYLVGYLGDGSRGQIFPIGESDRKVDELQGQQANACTLTTRYEATGNGSYIVERKQYAQIKTNNSKGFEEMTEEDSLNYSNPNSKTRRGRVGKGVAQTLDTGCEQAVIGAMRGQKDNYVLGYSRDKKGKVVSRHKKDIANTIHSSSGTGNNTDQFVNSIRRLTPIECERLQGFPNNWTQYGTEGLISDTQRYKMCGNAVTVDVVKAVGERIKDVVYKL